MGLTFFSRIFWTFAPLYGYLDWYIQQDRLQPYKDYAAILRAFQSYTPDRRLTLKAPMHTASIDAIRQVIPDAMIIQVHREPAQAFSSLNSLFFNLHSRSVKRFDLPRTIEHNLQTWDIELAQNIAMREAQPESVVDVHHKSVMDDHHKPVVHDHHKPVVHDHHKPVVDDHRKSVVDVHHKSVVDDHRKSLVDAHHKPVVGDHHKPVVDAHHKPVVDVHYEQLRSDPQGVVTNIYHHFGLEITDLFHENLQGYIRENRQGTHGQHPYAAADFGLSEDTLNKRFAAYREYFGYTASSD
jgi:hypothetical protein